MKITSKIFDSFDLAAKKEALHTTHTYRQVADLYNKFVLEFTEQQVCFLTHWMKDATLHKKYDMIEKFVDIAIDLNVPFEVYMKVQFEILVPFFKRVDPKMLYPRFWHLTSDKAIERFKDKAVQLKERFTGTDWMDEYIRGSFVDVGKSILNSARRFYEHLKRAKDRGSVLELAQVVKEFEMMARAGQLSNVYVWSSPLECNTEFITNLRQETEKKLTESQQFLAKKARSKLTTEFLEDKEIAKYV